MARYTTSGTVNTVQQINAELEKIQTAQEEFLTRDGQSPNEMKADLDMNSNRIINLPKPLNPTSPVRLQDITLPSTEGGNVVQFEDFLEDGVSTAQSLVNACKAGTVVVFDNLDVTFEEDFIYPEDGVCIKFVWRNTTLRTKNSSALLLGDTQDHFIIEGINAVFDGGLKTARLTADFIPDGVSQLWQVEAGHDFVVGDQIASGYNNRYLPNSTSRLDNGTFPMTDFARVTATTATTLTIKHEGIANEAIPTGQQAPITGGLLLNTRFDKRNIDFKGKGSFSISGVRIQNCGNAFAVSVVDVTESCNVFIKNVQIDRSALDASKFVCNSLNTESFSINDTVDIGKQGVVWSNSTKNGTWNSYNDTFTPNNNDALLYINPDVGTTGYMPNINASGMFVDGINLRPTINNDLFSLNLTDFLSMARSVIVTLDGGSVYMSNCKFINIDRALFGSTFAPVTNAGYGDMVFVNCFSDSDVFHERANVLKAPAITYIGGYMRVNIFTLCLGTNKINFQNTVLTEDFPLNEDQYFTESSNITTRIYRRGDYILNTATGAKHKCVSLSSAIGDDLNTAGYLFQSNRISKGVFEAGTRFIGKLDLNSAGVILRNVRLPKRAGLTIPRFFSDYALDSNLILEGYTSTDATTPDLMDWFTKIDTDRPPVTFLFESTDLRGKFGGDGLSQNEYHLELVNLRNNIDEGPTSPLSVSGAFAYRPPVGTLVRAAKDRQVREVVRTFDATLSSAATEGDTAITFTAGYQVAEGDWIGVNVDGENIVRYYEVSDISTAPTYGLRTALATDVAIADNVALIKHKLLNPDKKSLFVSGGDVLSAFQVNVLTDSGTYTLPPADLVKLNEYIDIELPELHKAETPTIVAQDTDLIEFSGGSDTQLIFDTGASVKVRLFSDGIRDWRL